MGRRATPDLTAPAKCTVCVVNVQGGVQVHHKKITVNLDPVTVQRKIEQIFAGHIVCAKKRAK